MAHGEGRGKVLSLARLRALGVERVDLPVGDRPHDLHAYLHNGHVAVERAVIIVIEDEGHLDPDRAGLPRGDTPRPIPAAAPRGRGSSARTAAASSTARGAG
jgi:hypothetical protein